MSRRLELLSNSAVVIASLAVCTAVGLQFRDRQRVARDRATITAGYVAGQQLEKLSNVDYGASDETLLMVVRSTCHFCTDSMGFYRDLTASVKGGSPGIRIIALCTELAQTCSKYLSENSVSIDQVEGIKPNDLAGVRGTPTLILIDRRGTVKATWRGKLSADGEKEVRRALVNGANAKVAS